MNTSVDEALRSRVKNLEAMPAMPAVLAPLMTALELPPEQVELNAISELIARDKSISAPCLRMANSALFAGARPVDSIRGAVVSLGARRLRDIVWTTLLLGLAPKTKWPLSPSAFWEHSFGVALVSQELAKKMALPNPDKAYLCGLLHDIGEVVNATLLPNWQLRRTYRFWTPNDKFLVLPTARLAKCSPSIGNYQRIFTPRSNFTMLRNTRPLPRPFRRW